MDSEKVKEIKEALKQNDGSGMVYEVDYKKRTCKFIHHEDILTLINELESENKELRVVVDIANERTYRKKFTDEWRKEYQKDLTNKVTDILQVIPVLIWYISCILSKKTELPSWKRKKTNLLQSL